MRLKTFLATYLLFLFALFSCFGIISAFMTDTQTDMQMRRAAAEYQRIAVSLSRDIAVLHVVSSNISEDINALVGSYMEHYAQANVTIELTNVPLESFEAHAGTSVSFAKRENGHFIEAVGVLPEPFGFLRFNYRQNVTDIISDMERVQNVLLLICASFAAITAFVLYFVLSRIFRPLGFVSQASRKISKGNYSERIHIKGKNELSAMADDFNRMADEIER